MASSFDSALETPTFGTLAKLAENIVYRVPGCADIMVRKIIREVARDFFRRSCCFRTTRRILLENGVRQYTVEPVHGGLIDRIERVSINEIRRPLVQGRDYSIIDGRPPSIRIREIYVDLNTDTCDVLNVVAVEIPDLESESAPAWLIQKHGDAICSGVLARLHGMLNKPWSDAQSASKELLAYENAVGFAATDYACDSQFGNSVADNPLASQLL